MNWISQFTQPSGWSQFDFGRTWHYLTDEAIVLSDDLCLEFAQLLFDSLIRHAFNRHWFNLNQESLDDLLPLLWARLQQISLLNVKNETHWVAEQTNISFNHTCFSRQRFLASGPASSPALEISWNSSSSKAFSRALAITCLGKLASSATWIPKLWSQTPKSNKSQTSYTTKHQGNISSKQSFRKCFKSHLPFFTL